MGREWVGSKRFVAILSSDIPKDKGGAAHGGRTRGWSSLSIILRD